MAGNTTASFNYTFDYSNYDDNVIGPETVDDNDYIAKFLKIVIGFVTVVGMIILAKMIIMSENSKFFGFQCYSTNLIFVNLFNIMALYCNDNDVSISSFVSSHLANTIKKHNYTLKNTASTVYCTSTFLLIYETTQRYRRNIIGLPLKWWLLLLSATDIVPLIMNYIDTTYYQYSSYKPKPAPLYQLTWLLTVTFATFVFTVTTLFMSVRRKREETFMTDPEPAFLNRQHMRKFCIYLLSTLWIQYLTNYMLPAQVFTVQVDPEASLKLLPKIQPYIKHIMDLHMYATFFKPMIETYSCIMFLRN